MTALKISAIALNPTLFLTGVQNRIYTFLAHLREESRQVMLSRLMSVVTIRHEASEGLLSVIQTISEKHYCCVLIGEYDKPTGVITERDIPRLFATHGLKEGMTAGDVMSLLCESMAKPPFSKR